MRRFSLHGSLIDFAAFASVSAGCAIRSFPLEHEAFDLATVRLEASLTQGRPEGVRLDFFDLEAMYD
jgi:hypothetical protein